MNAESVYDPKFLADVDKMKTYADSLAGAIATLTPGGLPPDVVKPDFTIPENPEYHYDEENGTITITDEAGNPHEIELPKKEDGTTDLPATIEDQDGNTYEVDEKGNLALKESNTSPDYPGTYSPEYMILIGNTIDNEDGKSETKGFSRNYFVAEDEAEFKLQQWVEYSNGSIRKTDLTCFWYIDSVSAGKDMTNKITLKKPQGAYRVEARDSSNNVLIHLTAVFIDSPEIVFTTNKDYDGEYGFDDNRFDEIAVLNEYKELDGLNKYRIPFMSLIVKKNASIEARLAINRKGLTEDDLKEIEFNIEPSVGLTLSGNSTINSNGTLKIKISDFIDNKLDFNIYSKDEDENAFIIAYLRRKIIGKIMIESKNLLLPSQIKLVKVIVNDTIGKNIDIEAQKAKIEYKLNNKSYNQGFAQWKVSVDDKTVYVNLETPTRLDSILIKAKDKYGEKQEKDYIMFICAEGNDCGLAYPFDNPFFRYSIIPLKNDCNPLVTSVHELGHNHGFQDLYIEYPSIFNDTFNFMDYSKKRNMFWKWQWNEIFKIHYKNNY